MSKHVAIHPTYHSLYRIPLALLTLLALLSGCTEIQVGSHLFKNALDGRVCKQEGDLKVGSPYKVDGVRYQPIESSLGYSEKGIASWYGRDFHGKATANGECYNMYAYTAAHKTLPLPTLVRVTNLENGRNIVLKVNDRGPFVRGRVIDLSYAAAQSLGVVGNGTAPVQVDAISGPHHFVGGLRGNTQLAREMPNLAHGLGPTPDRLAPPPQPTEALAQTAPVASIIEEDLGPAPTTPQARSQAVATMAQNEPSSPLPAAEAARLERQVPHTETNLPPPPPESTATNPTQLIHTNAYIQVGAFANVANAESLLDKLRAIEPSATLNKLETTGGTTLTRVRSGPYATLAEAEAVLARLVTAGFDGARIAIEQR